jgi:hypothetical protein
MARYRLGSAIVGQAPNSCYQKYRAGTTLADSVGNAIAGDIIWPSLAAQPNSTMVPLDLAAQTIMQATFGANNPYVCTTVGGASVAPTGTDSVA